MITTQELARLAGVSQSTVSRSLNDSPDISEKTRQRIQALAKQHGYVPRRSPAALRRAQKQKAVGIILSHEFVSTPLDYYLETLFNSIYNAIDRQGFYSLLLQDHPGAASLAQIEQVVRSGTAAGFILILREHNHEIEQCLQQYAVPHVYTQYFSRPLQKSMNIVDLDHYTGGYMAAQHLVSLGHRSVCTLTHNGSDFADRTAGFLAALRDSGLPHGAERVLPAHPSYNGGCRAVEQNLALLQGCTGLFAQSDMMGIGCMARLSQAGLRVPDDFSVIGFDGIEPGVQSSPPLTTILQPVEEITAMALSRLLRLIDRPDTKVTHAFAQPRLLVRGSTAPPAR